MSHLKKLNTRTRFLLLFCALLIVSGPIFALRAVSADSLNKFGITEQSRTGKLLGTIAPRTFASKSTDTAQGEAALKLLKDRGQYASLQQAMETARYRAQAEPQRAGEFAALNPAQELHSRFTPQGIEVRRRSDEAAPKLAMTLRGIGYGERQLPVSPGTVTAQDQRIEIHRTVGESTHSALSIQHSALTEWYINRPTGLEQGFTISQPPGERAAGERLRLTLELSGEWRAKLGADGQAVDFREASGGGAVRYDHLAVRDAQGKTLPARMSLVQRELRLEVEDAGAVWPVTIDPTISQQAYLKASNTGESDQFGSAVSVSGDTMVVGAPTESSNATGVNGNQADDSAPASGAVYVFTRSGSVWTQQAYLKASNTEANDEFGWSVAVSGDTVVVGSPGEGSNATGVNGNQANNSASFSGAAYVFTRSAGVWTQQAYLKASNTGMDDYFGYSVGVSGDTVIVGAWKEDSNATGVNGNQADNSVIDSGAAYVFTRSGVTWTQQAYLKASNTGTVDYFGYSVGVSGDTVAVGALLEDSNATGVNGDQTNNSGFNSGAAYVFTRSGVTWTQQAYLKASNNGQQDFFGTSVTVSGDTVVVGANGEDSNATGVNGNQADNSASNSGAAYVFTHSGTTWTQQAYLKASNTGANDVFGTSVAVSGDTVVVGAVQESSNATGINGNQADNSASFSGAAYVFTRSGVTWTQQAYLKASNTEANDQFGYSVAVSGNTVVVGAIQESSNATGVNGNQADNSAAQSGAVYVFANTPPGITAQAGVSRQQGSPASNSIIATVSDAETAAGSLTVTVTSANPSNGVTLSNIVNTNGTITADIVAGCAATNASFTLQVSDGGLTATAALNVTVTANTPPVLTYPATPISVANGGSVMVNPLTGPSDNGSVVSVSPASQTFKGTISSNSAGVISLSNAGPGGTHTITVGARDNCNTDTIVTFTVTVGCLNSLTVNSLSDGADATPGNNICETAAGNGVCTLRAALQEAHAQIACAPFTINFAVAGTINLNSALPSIFHPDLTLNGPGAQQLAVRSNAATPITIFVVDDNSFSVKKLTINGLTMRDSGGGVSAGPGGQVTVNDCVVTNNQGGFGVSNNASLTVNNSAIVGNMTTETFTSAIGVIGTLTMTNCTISGNTNTGTGEMQPSALFLFGGSATLTNCTISGNTGRQTILQSVFPGLGNSTLTLTNCTVAGNTLGSATTAYGVLDISGNGALTATLQLKNTLVANNTVGLGANFRTAPGGVVTSLGNNLDSDGSSGFTGGVNGNLVGTIANPLNALLASLGNYGGATQTIALLPGSPAINAGTSTGAPTNDQRGIARTGSVDIGAFESRGFTMAIAGGNNQSAIVNTNFSSPLAVTVVSAFSEPTNGGQVTFTPPASGASATLVGNPAAINLAGQASVTATANGTSGAYQVTATATGATGSASFNLANTCPAITVNPASATLAGGTAGTPYSQSFTATGGQTPHSFTNSAGTLPPGLTLNSSGLLSGTPTGFGVFNFTIKATDANGCFGERAYTLRICAIISLTASLPAGTTGVTYNQTITASGGASPYGFTVTGGNLPQGLSLNSTGALTGTPTQSGPFTFTVTATDANGCTGAQSYNVTINCQTVTVTPATLTNGFVSTNYNQSLTATGGTAPYSFTVSAGTLSAGVNLSSGGALSGTPTAQGTFTFTIRATDANGCSGERGFTVIISGDGLVFYPLPRPVRILDTRANSGNCDNLSTPITGGTSLTTLARLTCEGITIPSTAKAITGNLTVLNQTNQIGFLTIYPGGNSLPLAANMIYEPNGILSNNFTVGLSADGKFNVFGERTIDVVADISGYYAPPIAGGLYYHPLSKPIRLIDTRAGQGNCDNVNAPIAGGTSLMTLARVTCEGLTIPSAAQAITGNATVINGSGQIGYLTIYPNGVPAPLAANMVYYPGQILSNAFTVSLNASGEFNIFGERTIDMAIDVAGYYSNEAVDANGAGLLLTPLERPLRIMDTRAGQGNCDAVSVPIPGGSSLAAPARLTCEGLTIPNNAQAVIGNATVLNQTTQAGYLTLYPDGVAQPLAANLIYFPNQILSNAFVVGLNSATGQFRIFAERTLDAVTDVSGFFAP